MGICVLGPCEVEGGPPLEPRDRIALEVLVVRRGQAVSAAEFADALWPGELPSSWAKQVQIRIGRLRKALGPDAIETTSSGYRLGLMDDEIDVRRFERIAEQARGLTLAGQPDRAAAAYGRALSIWGGRPFDDLERWPPGRGEAARLEELLRVVEEDWLSARLAGGEHREVAVAAEPLVDREPLRERRWAILALAQYQCARQADALRSISRARRVLAEQLGLDPGPELVDLEAAILRQDPLLDARVPPIASATACPYKGLAPFDASDADSFYGRDAEIEACVARLRSCRLLVVAGPSGSGKSSLVRAGVLPALKRSGRSTVVMIPGDDPLRTLIDTIATAGESTILLIDQLEELFASTTSSDEVRAFGAAVSERALHCAPVVVTVRSDHLGDLTSSEDLSRLTEEGLHLVTPLAGDRLRQAIERPAAAAGLRLEHGLVELLVRDCEGEPGALPMLSHALAETWRLRDGATLTVEAYRSTGGIHGAVARSADDLYDSLPVEERSTLRSILLRLVTPTLDGDPVRCRVASRTLLGDPTRDRLVGLLVRARLVTSEEETIEVAHEALARAWPRLQSWLDEDVAGQRVLRHLSMAADGWDSLGRPDTELYRGARLETALEWQARDAPRLTEIEAVFLATSADHAASDLRELTGRMERGVRQRRRLRAALAAIGVLLVGAIVAGTVAVQQADRAQDESRLAAARELTAAAIADLDVDAERSVLLSMEALRRVGEEDERAGWAAEEALHRALTTSRLSLRIPGVGGRVDWSPVGDVIATETTDQLGAVDIRDAGDGRLVRRLPAHRLDITGIMFDPTGSSLATTSLDGSVRIWDVRNGVLQHEITGAGGAAWAPSFSSDGASLAVAWPGEDRGRVRIIDPRSGRVVRTVDSVPGARAGALDPSGGRLAVISGELTTTVIDLRSGGPPLRLEGALAAPEDVAWSPDGTSIATAGEGSARLFHAATGESQIVIPAHGASVSQVAWIPDMSGVVTGSSDGTARVWSLVEDGPRELALLTAADTRSGIQDLAVSPDGQRVVTGSMSTAAALIWDIGIEGGSEVGTLPATAFLFGASEYSRDGRFLVSSGGRSTISVWDAERLELVRSLGDPAVPAVDLGEALDVPIGGQADFIRVSVAPDGALVAGIRWQSFDPEQNPGAAAPVPAGLAGSVEVFEVETGRRAFSVDTGGWANDLAWSPDGAHLAVAGGGPDGGAVTVVDRNGQAIQVIGADGGYVEATAFSADGDRLLNVIQDLGGHDPAVGRLEMWSWRAGDLLRTLPTEAWEVAASPDGDVIATATHPRAAVQAVTIRDAESGAPMVELVGHAGAIQNLVFSPDGSRLATAGDDGRVQLWDAATGAPLLTLAAHVGFVSAVSFSHDGSRLATTAADGTTRIWALDRDELVSLAERRVTRDLTPDECRRYLHTECPPG